MAHVLHFINGTDNSEVGTLRVVDGQPVATGVGATAATLVVVEPGNPRRRLTPSDGDEWLEAMRFNFRTPYLYTRLAQDKGSDDGPAG